MEQWESEEAFIQELAKLYLAANQEHRKKPNMNVYLEEFSDTFRLSFFGILNAHNADEQVLPLAKRLLRKPTSDRDLLFAHDILWTRRHQLEHEGAKALDVARGVLANKNDFLTTAAARRVICQIGQEAEMRQVIDDATSDTSVYERIGLYMRASHNLPAEKSIAIVNEALPIARALGHADAPIHLLLRKIIAHKEIVHEAIIKEESGAIAAGDATLVVEAARLEAVKAQEELNAIPDSLYSRTVGVLALVDIHLDCGDVEAAQYLLDYARERAEHLKNPFIDEKIAWLEDQIDEAE